MNFFDEYFILRDISSGGFGTACLVESKHDGSLCVAKFGFRAKNDDFAAVEADGLQLLNHPNLVKFRQGYYTYYENCMIQVLQLRKYFLPNASSCKFK